MSIYQGLTTSFKYQVMQGQINLASNNIYMALYNGNASLGPSTTNYTSANEITGTGYTAGGKLMTGVTVQFDSQNNIVFVNWSNVIWTPATFSARGALIYDATASNASIAVLDFGSVKSCSNSFTVTMPANTSTYALIRG